MEIVSKREAKARGLGQYYTGRPCKRGHLSGRYVCSGNCVECTLARMSAYRSAHRESLAATRRAYYAATRGHALARQRAWQAANLAKCAANNAARKAKKRRATPPWLTQEQIRAMARMYGAAKKYAALSGLEWHVDHVIPLRGEMVCGLHVPWNLQVIPAADNLTKHNKLLEAA